MERNSATIQTNNQNDYTFKSSIYALENRRLNGMTSNNWDYWS